MSETETRSSGPMRVNLASESPFFLGAMEVCPVAREVVLDGKPQALQPRVMQVLVALARRQGEVVSRDELVASCWEGLAVSEDAINRCISALRRLAEQATGQFEIETIAKVGYRLTVPQSDSDLSENAPPTHERASIAVLPFVNISADPEQEYFSDGITEDIITDLARWPSLAVASRNSTFRFKGQAIDPRAVGRELGVRFIVEGSVRRMGERIRITAQLIEVETGNHVWAERYDRPIADLFDVQDEVIQAIVGTLVGRVLNNETERIRRKPPSSLAAYDLALRGNWLSWDELQERAEAQRCFERAIELDPDYAPPYAQLAAMLTGQAMANLDGWGPLLDRPLVLAERAVKLADNDTIGHLVLAHIHMYRRSFDRALRQAERGMEINPRNPRNQITYAIIRTHLGHAEEGLEWFQKALRADPYYDQSWFWRGRAVAHFLLGHYADALMDLGHGPLDRPRYHLLLAIACCAKLGLKDRANEMISQCMAEVADANVVTLAEIPAFKLASDKQHLAECLRLAGLPD